MGNTVRKMPVGIQDFEKLRKDGFLYVDKTEYVYQLSQVSVPYFLGRPRRFGKSLFLSTLKSYFLGKKDLFEGLAISYLEKEWTEYPVIYLDFNRESYSDLDAMYASLDANLRTFEEIWGRNEADTTPAIRFSALIQRVHEKSGKKVVVLVDEYDKALVATMDKPELNKQIRNIFKGFYGVLKAEDAHLRFVFLTGVTKFSKVSIFSDLNQLTDISMDDRFAEICGISETELLHNFQPEIEALANRRKMTCDEAFSEMKKRYDGYHFAKESEDIYNPFSVLNTFAALDFANYWFQTGTPTILVKHLTNTAFDIPKLENDITISADSIMDYRVENNDYIPLLYQSGYLTIKSYSREYNEYTLGFPNEEVKYGFLNELLPQFTPSFGVSSSKFSATGFIKLFKEGNIEGTMQMLQAYFATIEYDAIPKALKREKFFQFVFWQLFTLMGQFVRTEVKNNKGRADAVVWTAGAIYIFEFKMEDNATAENALQQIDSKEYSIPFVAEDRKIVKIGVEFSISEGGIKRWAIK